LKPLIEVIAKALVDHPDEVQVKEIEKDRLTVYQLTMNANDVGKVIGKQGRVAKALRTVVNAAATANKKRVTIDIM
jgi:predicted RNA-binding protein YlqC (UPF0109 family)